MQSIQNEREGNRFRPRLSASIDLPKTKHKLKLSIESSDSGALGATDEETALSDESSSAVLRYNLFDLRNWNFDLDLGIRLSGGPFTRARGRYYYAFNEQTIGRITQDLVFDIKHVWYETSRFSLQHYANSGSFYQWVVQAKHGDETDGTEWSITASRADKLSERSALTSFISAVGATDDDWNDDESEIYKLGFNYRRSVLRPWFFFELEPQLTYPRKYDYHSNWHFVAGIEIQFGRRAQSFF